MLMLTPSRVRLGRSAADKAEAIRQVGQVMVDAGFIAPGDVDSMLQRAQVSPAYLGHGLAIPNALPAARDLMLQTGGVVVRFPAGVARHQGGHARLVMGSAARSDEHLQVLANLTGALGDEALAGAAAELRARDALECGGAAEVRERVRPLLSRKGARA